ncbi:MAG: glycosyltransferase family 2 protein [bacterium]
MKLPKDFNWEIYLKNYPDIRKHIKGHDQKAAEYHYLMHGQTEGRVYSHLINQKQKITPNPKKKHVGRALQSMLDQKEKNKLKKQNLLKKDEIYIPTKIINFNKDKFSIIIPTMWVCDDLKYMLDVYEKSEYVGEIIIIDNNPEKKFNLDNYKKIIYLTKGYNIYVNPAWNWGYSVSKHKTILANDDITINPNNFDFLMGHISCSDFDIVGVSLENTGITPKITKITEWPSNSYGCFMYIKNYTYIPNNIKIYRGDFILFESSNNRGILENFNIISKKSQTVKTIKNLNKITKNDRKEYNLLKNKKINSEILINIITRTSNRPIGFKRCYDSIQNQTHKNIKHIVSYDNPKDLSYLKNLNIDLYDVSHLQEEEVQPNGKKIYKHNLYINYLLKQIDEGWILLLDDDDNLINEQVLENLIKYIIDENDMLIFQMKRTDKTIPENEYIDNKKIKRNHIGSSCILFNSKYKNSSKFEPYRSGDFDFIEGLYQKIPNKIWIKKPFIQINGQGLGLKKDLKKLNL